MLYIGFSNHSNKLCAKIFCNKYQHCAPIVIKGNTVVIYQFVNIRKITKITIHKKDLSILEKHGWRFIKYSNQELQTSNKLYLTCVQFTKSVCGIKNITIQTPLALFKYLSKK